MTKPNRTRFRLHLKDDAHVVFYVGSISEVHIAAQLIGSPNGSRSWVFEKPCSRQECSMDFWKGNLPSKKNTAYSITDDWMQFELLSVQVLLTNKQHSLMNW